MATTKENYSLIPTLDTANGMLSPDGKLYPCRWTWHDALCRELKDNGIVQVPTDPWCDTQDYLRKKGWVKLQSCEGDNVPAHGRFCPVSSGISHDWNILTQKQIDTIHDWCEHHGVDLPKELQPSLEQAA